MAGTKGFEIGLRVVLGNFAFQKMAIVKDLRERAAELLTHDIIAAVAGDGDAKRAINAEQSDPDPKEFDRVPPDSEFLVMDADSSQQRYGDDIQNGIFTFSASELRRQHAERRNSSTIVQEPLDHTNIINGYLTHKSPR